MADKYDKIADALRSVGIKITDEQVAEARRKGEAK